MLVFYEQTPQNNLLPGGPFIGVLGDSIWSLWIDFGRCFFGFATWGRGRITVSMSSMSFSCFRLIYSCLINSLRALSSSFFWRSSSVLRLRNQLNFLFCIPKTSNTGESYMLMWEGWATIFQHLGEKCASFKMYLRKYRLDGWIDR
jgi:hypothetical protein